MNAHHRINTDNTPTSRRGRSVIRLILAALGLTVAMAGLVSGTAAAQAPDHDLAADPIVIDPAALPFTDSVDTSEATSDQDDVDAGCPAPATGASVWYSITPTTDMLLVVDGTGSDFEWGIAVGTGGPGTWGLGECRPFSFLVEAEANVTYYIQVFDGESDGPGAGGNLEFAVRESTAAADATVSTDIPDAPFVLQTAPTFNDEGPATGTFSVLAGADTFGCTAGSFEDVDIEELEDLLEITKLLSCEKGPMTGTVSVRFRPGQDSDAADRQRGPWEVIDGTGDFVGISGQGDHEVVFESSTTGVETISGMIEFAQAPEQLAQTGAQTSVLAVFGGLIMIVGLVLLAVRGRLLERPATGRST